MSMFQIYWLRRCFIALSLVCFLGGCVNIVREANNSCNTLDLHILALRIELEECIQPEKDNARTKREHEPVEVGSARHP